MKSIIEQAYEIGYEDATAQDSLTVPAYSEKLSALIKENCKEIGDSIPLLKAYHQAQADWLHNQTAKFCTMV